MTLRDEVIREGGNCRLAFGLRIEGIPEMFVTDPRRATGGSMVWELGDNDEQYGVDGLDYAGEYAFEERIDWQTATLDAATLTVVVNDRDDASGITKDAASRVFGGRVPTKRTWLAAALSDTATTVTVSSTTGWSGSEQIHIGREMIQLGGIGSGTTFIDCNRGIGGTLAVTHNYEAERPESIEVTDQPVAVKGRRAQLYCFVEDTAESEAFVVWRGIVRHVEQTEDGLGWSVTLDHVSALLDQEIGETLGPFTLDGYWFPDEAPLRIRVDEFATESPAADPTITAQCNIEIVGRYGTRDTLLRAINAAVQPSSASWSATPVNIGYSASIGNGNQLIVQFRTGAGEAGDPRWVNVYCLMPGCPSEPTSYLIDEDGEWANSLTGVTGAMAYTVIPEPGRTRWERDEFPDAATVIRARSLTVIPEDGAAATHPPNRIYHGDESVTADVVTEIVGPPPFGFESSSAGTYFSVLDDGAGYLTVGRRASDHDVLRGGLETIRYYGWHDAPVEFSPVLVFERQRLDTWLKAIADATPDSGTSGVTPYLPSAEFDWTDIERVVMGAGGDAFAKEWRIHRAGSLREMVSPELLAMGLCWATTATGLITLVPISVASGAIATTVTIAESTNGPALTPTISIQPDGVINIVEVRGGWNAETESYDNLIGAASMPASWEHFGKQRLTIEPKGTELRTDLTDLDFRARVAKSLCHIYAFPYGVMMFARCPGLLLADALLGQNASITDARAVWKGVRGLTTAKGQIVGRRVAWGGAYVDLWVMLTDWNATAYSPAAKLSATTPMGGTDDKRLTMRNEAVYSPSDAADYTRFAAGDKIIVRRIDYITFAVEESLTIDSIDTTNHYIYVTTTPVNDFNVAGTRWIMEYDDYDTCEAGANAATQLLYAFIADSGKLLGTSNDQAQVWAA